MGLNKKQQSRNSQPRSRWEWLNLSCNEDLSLREDNIRRGGRSKAALMIRKTLSGRAEKGGGQMGSDRGAWITHGHSKLLSQGAFKRL